MIGLFGIEIGLYALYMVRDHNYNWRIGVMRALFAGAVLMNIVALFIRLSGPSV